MSEQVALRRGRPRAVLVAVLVLALVVATALWFVLRGPGRTPEPVEPVGTAATFASGNASAARTSVPGGAQEGDLLVSVVSTFGFSSVRFAAGWTTIYDVGSAAGVRMAAAWKVKAAADTAVTAAVTPATQVTMATVALRNAASPGPVEGAAGVAGDVSPDSVAPAAGGVLVFTHASTAWKSAPAPPDGASLQASVNNAGNSEVSVAIWPASGGAGVAESAAGPATAPASGSGSASGPASGPASGSAAGAGSGSAAGSASGSAARSTSGMVVDSASVRAWRQVEAGSPAASGTIVIRPAVPGASPAPATSARSAAAVRPSGSATGTAPPLAGTLAPLTGSAPTAGRQVCDTPALNGLASAPDGAVTVLPSQNLGNVVESRGGAATYWLAPGVHRLGTGPYDSIVPHSGDSFIGAPGAILDGQHRSLYAFTGEATGVVIRNVTIQNFGAAGQNNNEGVINKDSSRNWQIIGSTIQDNAGAGVMLGSGNRLISNCLRNNGQYAFNAYNPDGVADLVVDGNEISGNNTDNWEVRQPDCGCTGGGKFWATVGARVTNNYVHDNKSVGLWADSNNSGFLIEGNYISGNDAEGVLYEISYNARIANNTFVRNALVSGPKNPKFPTGAIYLSESGSDRRAPGPYADVLRVSGNVFKDNWSGVVAWENADRFAGSPANTSSGMTTLVSPRVATEKACATSATVAKTPYLDDCRWKTKNVLVDHNTFTLDPRNVPGCSADTGCGFNGLFSNYGSFPDWSPYKGTVVQDHITFSQKNVWRENTYAGPWNFMVHADGNVVPKATWQAAPYGQDAGSTFG